jgi:acyl-CoA thioester hydrolase
MDNDVYGHVNNVVYYSFFDTVVNRYLIDNGALDFRDGKVIGLVVETQCNYFKPVAYPDRITAALAVEHLGNSSVRYRLAVFSNDDNDAAAQGHFVHVYVDRATNRPVPLPDALRKALERIAK